jgi:hypothetical protein
MKRRVPQERSDLGKIGRREWLDWAPAREFNQAFLRTLTKLRLAVANALAAEHVHLASLARLSHDPRPLIATRFACCGVLPDTNVISHPELSG